MTNQTIPPCPVCGVVPTKHAKNDRILLCGCFGEYGAMTADVVSLQKYQLMCVDMLGRALRDLGIETVAQVRELAEKDPRVTAMDAIGIESVSDIAALVDGLSSLVDGAKAVALHEVLMRKINVTALRRRAAKGEK